MPDLDLRGCRTTPLLSYLKALGIFRHVAKADSEARLWWSREGFARLRSRFDDDGLVQFFMEEYEPSPITSPWNGGSGYFPGTYHRSAIETLGTVESSGHPRLTAIRATIQAARGLLGGRESIGDKDSKAAFLQQWRALCPDPALDWLDASMVLSSSGPTMNPILGAGGGDGRLDFSANFLGRLIDCLPHVFSDGPLTNARAWARGAINGDPVEVVSASVGMFSPGDAALPNSSSSPREDSFVNPWGFVLMLEGVLFFAGGTGRRLNADRPAFPFAVSTISHVGRSLDVGADANTKGELWLPVWNRPAGLTSIIRLFAEGRTQDGRHQARNGRELRRAVADAGVDRGISAFERFVFVQRRTKDYREAIPAGHVPVRSIASADMLRTADWWLDRARPLPTTNLRRTLGELERAEADVTAASNEQVSLERWLLALARTQRAVARRPSSRDTSGSSYVAPLGGLDPRIVWSLEDSVEHRLARALAAIGRDPGDTSFRSLVEPVVPASRGRFEWRNGNPRTSADLRRPMALLVSFAEKQLTEPSGSGTALDRLPDTRRARLADVATFLDGATDDARIVQLAYAFSLCRPCDQRPSSRSRRTGGLDRLYAVCRLATDPRKNDDETAIRRSPEIVGRLAAGNASLALRAATRRLRANGSSPMRSLETIEGSAESARRIAAALAFPLALADRVLLERTVLIPDEQPSSEGAIA